MSILLTGEYHMEDDRSLAIKFREVSFPGVLDDAIPSNDGLSALGQRDGSSFSSNPRNLRTNFDPINDREQWALTGIITYDASDVFTLRSLTSYRDFEAIFFHDFDMSSYLGYPLAQTGPLRSSANHWQPVFQHQFSQELQVNVETDNFHGVFGLFYLDETVEVENHIGLDVLTNTDPFRVQFDGRLDINAWAAYANVTYDLSDQFSLKAGARYSLEERHLANNTGLGSAALNRLVLDPLQWDVSKIVERFLALARRRVPAQRRLDALCKLVARLQERHRRDRLDAQAVAHPAAAVRRAGRRSRRSRSGRSTNRAT